MKPLRVLFLTPTPVGDKSFGGAIRSSDLRQALIGVAEVDTLVIEGGPGFVLEPNWNDDRVRRLTHTARGASLRGLRETARVRCVVGELLKASPYDFIVARYLGQAMYVPKGEWGRRLIIDPDDVYKSLSDPSPSLWARIKVGLRNEMVARLLRRARHVWIVNPVDAARLKLWRASMLGNIVVVPPLVRPRPPVVPNRVLMVGFFPHPPNAEGLRWFSTEVLPALRRHYPDLQLHAVGKPPPDLTSSAALVVRGYVADLAAEYASAALVIAPIFAGPAPRSRSSMPWRTNDPSWRRTSRWRVSQSTFGPTARSSLPTRFRGGLTAASRSWRALPNPNRWPSVGMRRCARISVLKPWPGQCG